MNLAYSPQAGKVLVQWDPDPTAVRYSLSVKATDTGIPVAGRDTAPPKTAAAVVSNGLKPGDYLATVRRKDSSGQWGDLVGGLSVRVPACPLDHNLDTWPGVAATTNDAFASGDSSLYWVDGFPAPALYLRRSGRSIKLSDLTRSTAFYRLAVLPDQSVVVLERFNGINAVVSKYSPDGVIQWVRSTGFNIVGALYVTSAGNIIVFVLRSTLDVSGNQPAATLTYDADGNQLNQVDMPLTTVWPGGSVGYPVKPAIVESRSGAVHLFVKTDGAPWVDLYRFSPNGQLLSWDPKFLASWRQDLGVPQDGNDGPDGEMPVLSAAAVGDEVWLAYATPRTPAFTSDFFAMVGPYSKPPEDFGEWNPAREINVCRVSASGAKAFLHPPAVTERITCLSLSQYEGRAYLLYKQFDTIDQSFDAVQCTVWNGNSWCVPVYLGPGAGSPVHCSAGRGVWQEPCGMKRVDLTWIGDPVVVPSPAPAPPPPPTDPVIITRPKHGKGHGRQ